MLLNFSYFIVIGSVIPWVGFVNIGIARLIAVSVWILLLRRLPITMSLYKWIPSLKSAREAFFFGWFGPIGAGAIYYACVCVVYLEVDPEPLFSVVVFIVISSIVVHGGSVSLFDFGISRVRRLSAMTEPGLSTIGTGQSSIIEIHLTDRSDTATGIP